MKWKNQIIKTPYLLLLIILISIGVGTASAFITITLAGNVVVTGNLDVTGGSITSERPINDGNTDNLVIQRPEGATTDTTRFVFSQRTSDTDLWLYGYNGSKYKNFVGFDYPSYKITVPASSNALVIDGENKKVGIGTSTPQTELDVVGNATIVGNLDVTGISNAPKMYIRYDDTNFFIFGNSTTAISIGCDSGDIAIGGGFQALDFGKTSIEESYHGLGWEGWSTVVRNEESYTVTGNWTAICMDVSLPAHTGS